MAFSLGETLQAGTYRLEALLEERQWGKTFLATHLRVDQPVLIKTFQATDTVSGPSRAQVDSFIRYAQKLTRFHYPQLSRVSSTFEENQIACMVSEYVQGESLSQLIQSEPLPESIALRYLYQVAQGLHALHRHGLLHLNLRPSRILTRNETGDVVLIGLNSRFSNHPDEVEGKPYLALEQSQSSEAVGVPSEIYGVAATLYTLVTGTVPIAAVDRRQTPLPSPRQLRSDLSPDLEQAILHGMALDRRDRPQSLKAWLKLLPKLASEAALKTTLQVPPSWKVKLPAFREAGFKNSVSTVINSEAPAPPVAPKTTLQSPVSEPIESQVALQPDPSGHPELDSILAELSGESPAPQVSHTTLQAAAAPPIQPEVTSSQSSPVPPKLNSSQSVSTQSVSTQTSEPEIAADHQETMAIQTPEQPSSATSLQVSPEPVLLESSAPIQPDASDMTTAFPNKSRFPKWTLFWCALVAACAGLGAGLWFRGQLTQQFATPVTPFEDSPLDKLRSLDTKEEKFLPTDSSVIPEERLDESDLEDTYDPNESADLELAPRQDYDAISPLDEDDANVSNSSDAQDAVPETVRDYARDRLSREGLLDSPTVPVESESLQSGDVEAFDPAILDDNVSDPAIESEDPDSFLVPEPSIEEPQSDQFTSNNNSLNLNFNTF